MPITPFLRGQAFEPEALKSMSDAFIRACEKLRLTDRSDPATELVAIKIIGFAEHGILETETLLKRTLQEFNIRD